MYVQALVCDVLGFGDLFVVQEWVVWDEGALK